MLLNIPRRLPPGWIARRHLLALALIPPHVIHPHDSRKLKMLPINPRPRITNPQIQHDAHRLLAHDARAHIPIRPDGPPVHLQTHVVTHKPGNVAVGTRAGGVLERILLVLRAVVPGAVQRRGAGDGLLVSGATIAVHGRDVVVPNGEVVVVGPPEDVKGRDLVRLRDDAQVRAAVGARLDDVDFGGATAATRRRMVLAGAGARGEALTRQLA